MHAQGMTSEATHCRRNRLHLTSLAKSLNKQAILIAPMEENDPELLQYII